MFITEKDLKLGMYKEHLDAITREDSETVEDNIETSLAEIDTYLNGIYNTDAMWVQVGRERNPFVKKLAISITLYNICSPLEEIPVAIVENRKLAIEMLEKIRDGKNMLKGVDRQGVDDNQDGKIEEKELDNIIISGGISNRY